MKKILSLLIVTMTIFFHTFSVSAYEMTTKDETIVEKLDQKIFKIIDTKKSITAEKIIDLLENFLEKRKLSERIQEIIIAVIEDIEEKYLEDPEDEEEIEEIITEFTVKGNEIHMNNEINSRTYEQFKEILEKNPQVDTLVELIVPWSLDDETMIKLAYYVREKGLTTKLLSNSEVSSGGTDLFLAGKKRIMQDWAYIWVHSWSDGTNDAKSFPKSSPEHDENKKYIEDMLGKEDFYWFTIYAAPANGMYEMTYEEIDKFKLVTEWID